MSVNHLLDIYGVHLHLVTDRRQEAALRRRYGPKQIPPKDPGEWGATLRFVVEPDDGPDETHLLFVINVASHRGDLLQLLDTCAHEAAHGALWVLEGAGAKYDSGSEPLAWLAGWLTRWLFQHATA